MTSPTSPKSSQPPISASTAKPRIAALAEIAEQELGKKETQGSNLGPDVRKYQAATNLDPGAWPWCAAFVCWCLQQWLSDADNRKWLALKKSTPAAWRSKTALAYGLLKWAEARPATVTILPDTAMPQAGDIVVYDFSHCGIVKEAFGDNYFIAIEGNTDAHGGREGDGVWKKLRPRSLARAFIRIRPSVA